ncbi:helix-turn-helix transcriptional regulator [Piscinibacter koreensis]|uniref:Response regulator transcription factor n=1 Tax=Piscinibacter koreensis TaxID=2742824 RepID=A0A7Y6NPP0_9BURK|nr:LuxR C-terminal-related transcriptional regulator [Schlegelella koreensis]NUZ07020.1 response regulator transcription factor [Schlegelella koreensis]
MHRWILDADGAPARAHAARAPGDALAGVIGSIGTANFGTEALASLNAALPVDSWSIYRVHRHQPPRLHASGSFGIPDTTGECFRVYRAGLYQADASFDPVHEAAPGAPAIMTHWSADELGAAHREQIYLRYGMRERLSLILAEPDGGLMSVNLYRHEHQRRFDDAEFEWAQSAARWLLACVTRHIELAARLGVEACPEADEPAVAPLAHALERLRRRCPGLTARETQICERLLRGWSHDGIASDLGLSVATVKTYRNRAFDRLGIHFRSELFSLAMHTGEPTH